MSLLLGSQIDSSAATFTVTNNTWQNTDGSLLFCVNQANATPGPDIINFQNNGTPYIIAPTAQITLNDQVTIDGSTSGFAVQLNGTNAPFSNGILLNAGASGSVIRGLFITNYIYNAIHVLSANNVQIGGDRSLNYGNLLSGNLQAGILIDNATETLVEGNIIGLNAAGTLALTNGFDGINITGTSTNNTIGGINANLRNVISGNGFNGINITNGANTIIGNYIGTNAAGTAAIQNGQQGIRIVSNANGTIIGGNTANHRNLISGNNYNGIYAFVGSHTITGNYIGTNATGNAAIPNVQNGISIESTSTANLIGGNDVNLRNLISGNGQNGINLFAGSSTVAGNYIGTDASGALALGNVRDGIRIAGTSNGNTIGGTTVASRNVISSNGFNGVDIESGANTVAGNYIGTNAAGTGALGNLFDGIRIAVASTNNVIGAGNVISGNISNGVRVIFGTHTIKGNYIGTDASGTLAIPNNLNGIDFITAGDGNIVGGLTPADRNVISGNTIAGIRSSNTKSLKIYGNIIGLDVIGLNDLGNGVDGIYGQTFLNDHEIGGATAAHRNIISGNGRDGIFYEFDITGLNISGNYIGTDINGTKGVGNLGNNRSGILFDNRTTGTIISSNVVSGNGVTFRNGQDNGVGIYAKTSTGFTITKNIVGLEADGLTAYGNSENGISLADAVNGVVSENIVSSNGSWHTDARATAASPRPGQLPFGHGIVIATFDNTITNTNISVLGNKIGVDKNGEGTTLGNLQSGLIFIFGDNFTVGSTAAADRNIIGNNLEFGIHFVQVGSVLSVKNNLIGESPTGLNIGNNSGGIYIDGGGRSVDLKIGGILPNESNVIANSTGTFKRFADACGVCVSGNSTVSGIRNLIFNNSITCNEGLGIDLNKAGRINDRWSNEWWGGSPTVPLSGAGNNSKSSPVVSASNSTTKVAGTGTAGDVIHVYDNTCDCEGETYLTSTTVAANGKWEVNLGTPVVNNSLVTAIAVDANNNTSEFSGCCRVKSDSIIVDKPILCFGESATISMVDHVGSTFQLQSSSSISGPWTNVGVAKTSRADSTWTITPTVAGTVFYRVSAGATAFGGATGTAATCNSTSKIVRITTSATLNVAIANLVQPSCGLDNGSFNINVSGGTAPFSYSIDDSVSFTTTSTYTSKAPNTYEIVTKDNTGCFARNTVTLNPSNSISLSLSATTFVCQSDTIKITPTVTGGNGTTTMNWNFGASSTEIFTLSPAVAGTYTGVVTDGSGCKDTASVDITIENSPSKANAGIDKIICTDTIDLEASVPTSGTGEWKVIGTNGSVQVPTSPNTYAYNYTEGQIELEWTVSNGICPASKDTVIFTRTPDLVAAYAGDDQTICTSSTNLDASGSGQWFQNGNANISEIVNPKTLVSDLVIGNNYFFWRTSNGVCKDVYDTVLVVRETVSASEIPNLTPDKGLLTPGETVTITQSTTEKNIRWYSSTNKIDWTLLPDTDNPIIANPTVPTFYTSIVDIKTCKDIKADTILVDIDDLNNPPTAKDDSITINEDDISVSSTESLLANDTDIDILDVLSVTSIKNQIIKTVKGKYGTLVWTDKGDYTYTLDNTLNVVQALSVGESLIDTFTYVMTDGFDFDGAILKVKILGVNDPPIAVDDIDNVTNFQEPIEIIVLINDSDIDGPEDMDSTSVVITRLPNHGTVILDTLTGKVTYIPNDGYQGDDSFEYQFSDFSGGTSNIATVFITVNQRPPMEVFEAVTPNGDNKNDYMHIENIEYYPNTNVQIFNRWGNLVWELPETCNGYQNDKDSECSFVGKSNVGLGSGGEVPDGSYYYVVDGSADGVFPCQGYLVKR